MKSTKEIYIRTVILQCLTTRVCLEMAAGAASQQTSEEREETRCAILCWLQNKGYYPHTTAEEKWLFELPVGAEKFTQDELQEIDAQCKAMEIFLWALNLTEQIPDLSFSQIGEYHKQLGISPDHVMEQELQRCRLRDEREIALQADIAFLWDWRINHVDLFATKGRDHNITDMVEQNFEDRYDEALKRIPLHIPRTARGSNDFVAWHLVVRELHKWQLRLMKWFTRWRHHAFVWMMNDDQWDAK